MDMKIKNLVRSIAALSLAIFALSSCIQRIDCPNCEGQNNQDGGTNWQILNFSVKDANWELCSDNDGNNKFYRAHLEIPELTKNIIDKGLMQAYVYLGNNQQSLPYVRHFEEIYDNGGTAEQYTWTQTVDIEYEEGGAWVYFTASDFYVDVTPGDWEFRIVLLW